MNKNSFEETRFGFVNYTGKAKPDALTRQFIRQNAMRRYRKDRRKNGRIRHLPPLQYALEVPDALFEDVDSVQPNSLGLVCSALFMTRNCARPTICAIRNKDPKDKLLCSTNKTPSAGPLLSHLGAGRIDPFQSLPTANMSYEHNEAIDHCAYTTTNHISRPCFLFKHRF
jgi:hypothetical protein